MMSEIINAHEEGGVTDNSGDMPREKERPTLTRRRLLKGVGGLIAAKAVPANGAVGAALPVSQMPPKSTSTVAPELTGRLASYMVAARDRSLSPKVLLDAKHHILDTLAAMVSGARLKPGELAIRFVRGQGGVRKLRSSPPILRPPSSTPLWSMGCSGMLTKPMTLSRHRKHIQVVL
jgi:hypothetical protein